MGDGSVNFNKLSFFQKVEMAKENLAAQGKSSPSTADIVKEMVNMEKAAKANDGALPEGYTIEHTGGVAASNGQRRAADTFTDMIQEVYGTPMINENLVKIAQMLERIMADNTLSDEAKAEAVDILKEMVKLLTTGGEIPKALVDLVDSMAININKEVYGTPVIPEMLYGTPDCNPKMSEIMNFVTNFLSNNAIPEDVKQKFIAILQNPDNLGGAENSAQTMLLNALTKLAKSGDVSEDVLKEIARLINELGAGNVVDIDDNVVINLYGTPDIPNNPNFIKYMEFVSRILSSDLPDEVKDALKDVLSDPSSIGTTASSVEELVVNTIRQLIEKGNLSGEEELQKLIDIANSLGLEYEIKHGEIFGEVIMVYGTPDIDPIINNPKVKVVLDFLGAFMANENIPDDIKAKMQEIFKDSLTGLTGEDVIVAEVLIDAVNKLISENELDGSVLNEIEKILQSFYDEININNNNKCVYDTPEIRNKRVLIVLEIIDKLVANNSNIPLDLGEELLQLLSDILHNLADEDKIPDGIKELLDNKTISDTLGTQKAFVSNDTNLEAKYPPDKFEILAKIPQDSKHIMVIYRKK